MKREERFSFLRFAVAVALQLALFLFAVRFFAPAIWDRQFAHGFLSVAATFLAALLLNCFVEFFFHRYMLHTAPIAALRRFAEQHRKHHGLTHVVRLNPEKIEELKPIRNRYPILEEEQHEASFFPYYALSLFLLFFTPLFLLLQLLLSGQPVFLGGSLAVIWSYILYEVGHAIEHLSYKSWWRPKVLHPRFGRFWTKVYGFHLMHHANHLTNEAIGGFILWFPLADFVFGTYKQPNKLLLDGTLASEEDFSAPPPRWPICVLDRWIGRREKVLVQKRQALARRSLTP